MKEPSAITAKQIDQSMRANLTKIVIGTPVPGECRPLRSAGDSRH